MARLRLSAAARRDLVEIRRYSVREFGGRVADTYFRGFRKAFKLLREQPFAGAVEPDVTPEVRVLTHRRHRIFYRVTENMVEIGRVLHHAQDSRTVLRDGWTETEH